MNEESFRIQITSQGHEESKDATSNRGFGNIQLQKSTSHHPTSTTNVNPGKLSPPGSRAALSKNLYKTPKVSSQLQGLEVGPSFSQKNNINSEQQSESNKSRGALSNRGGYAANDNINTQDSLNDIQRRFMFATTSARPSKLGDNIIDGMVDDIGRAEEFEDQRQYDSSDSHASRHSRRLSVWQRQTQEQVQSKFISPPRSRRSGVKNETDSRSVQDGIAVNSNDEAVVAATTAAADDKYDSIMERKAFHEIAHQTFNDSELNPQGGQKKVRNDDITVGSQGIIATEIAATTQPTVGFSKTMMTTVDGSNVQTLKDKGSKNQSQILFAQSSTTDDLGGGGGRTTSLTKAEISLEDVYTKKTNNSALGVFDKNKMATNSTFSQLAAPVSNKNIDEGGHYLQLPAVRGQRKTISINDKTYSQALLTHGSSLKGNLAGTVNLQSQTPLQQFNNESILFDESGGTIGKLPKRKRQSVADATQSAMPPLQNLLLSQSLVSSANKKKRETTPGQNWQDAQDLATAQQWNYQNILSSTVLEPSFIQQFKMQDRGLEIRRRNQSSLTEHSQTVAQSQPKTIEGRSKDAVVTNVSNQIFNKVKVAKPIYGNRSQSVLAQNSGGGQPTGSLITPSKKPESGALEAATIQQRRYSSVIRGKGGQDMLTGKQPGKVRQLGFIDEGSVDERNVTKYSPKINFPKSNLKIGPNKEVTLKKIKNGTTPNRLEKGEKISNMPGQVIEQWIDAILKEEAAEASLEEHMPAQYFEGKKTASTALPDPSFPGIGKVQKIKESKPASVKYGLDYQSLTKNGLNGDQVLRLQRAIYVHTIGFYDVIMDSIKGCKNKKNVIISVLRIYQQLLEKCHKNEWKMLISEVANTYEVENNKQQSELKETIIQKDKIIADLKRLEEAHHDEMMEIKSKVYSEQEAFARLHETYLILQHHNEEGLSLRLQTESRLKELFKRDRQSKEVFEKTAKDRKEMLKEIDQGSKKIAELESQVYELKQKVKEKEGETFLIKEEMRAQKRTYSSNNSNLGKLETQLVQLQTEVSMHRDEASRAKADAIQSKLQATSYESQIRPLENTIRTLRAQTEHLAGLNKVLTEHEESSRKQMNEVNLELQEKLVMFNGAENTLAAKELEVNRMAGKYRTNTNRMYAYETEKDKLSVRLAEAEFRIKELTAVNDDLSSQIAMVSKHEHERETSWLGEIKKNETLLEKVEALEAEMFHNNTTVLFAVQRDLQEAELKVAELEAECEHRRTGAELEQKLSKEKITALHHTVEKMGDQARMQRSELVQTQRAETRARQKNVDLINRQNDIDKEIIELKLKVKNAITKEKNSRENNEGLLKQRDELRAIVQMYENTLNQKKAKKIAKAKAHAAGQALVGKQFARHEESQMAAINRNNMIGEDFRSQALVNYYKIIDLEDKIVQLNVEPQLLKEKYLRLFTKHRRFVETHGMELEDERMAKLALKGIIQGKIDEITELNRRHSEHIYLIQVMRRKMGSDFDVMHTGTQTVIEIVETTAQTDYPSNHVGIQAHGFNQADAAGQTEKLLFGSELLSDEGSGHYRMPAKKVIKRKKKIDGVAGKSGSSMSPQGRRGGSIGSNKKNSVSSSPLARMKSRLAVNSFVSKMMGSKSKKAQAQKSASPRPAKRVDRLQMSPTASFMMQPHQSNREQSVREQSSEHRTTKDAGFQLEATSTSGGVSGLGLNTLRLDQSKTNMMTVEANQPGGTLASGVPRTNSDNKINSMSKFQLLEVKETVEEANELLDSRLMTRQKLQGPAGAAVTDEQVKVLNKGKFKMERRQSKPGLVDPAAAATNPSRQGVYSSMKPQMTEKERRERNAGIKGLIRVAAQRDK